MWDCMLCSGVICIPFFLLTMIIGNLVVSMRYSAIQDVTCMRAC